MQQTVSQIVLILIIVGVFYFLLIRPQMKRQREREDLISSIVVGDKILTVGGIVGRVTAVKGDYMMLESGKNVILEMTKSAVAQKISET